MHMTVNFGVDLVFGTSVGGEMHPYLAGGGGIITIVVACIAVGFVLSRKQNCQQTYLEKSTEE